MVRRILAIVCAASLGACGGEVAEAEAGEDRGVDPAAHEDADTPQKAEVRPSPALAAPQKIETFPARFRGYWDSSDSAEFACTDMSDGMMFVDAKRIGFWEAGFEPKSIAQVSPNVIESNGQFDDLGEVSPQSYRIELAPDGEKLTLSGDGFDPFEYRKCGKELKEAKIAFIPDEFHGKWAFGNPPGCDAKPFRDLIVEERRVVIGGISGKVESMEFSSERNITVGYKADDGRDAIMRLGLMEGGKKIGFGEPGASGVVFSKCP